MMFSMGLGDFMRNFWKLFLTFVFLVCLCFLFVNAQAEERPDSLVGNVFGDGCQWCINDGVLYIWPENGISGTLPSYTYYSYWPWYNQRTSVVRVVVEDGVHSAYGLYGLFYGMTNCVSMDLLGLDTLNTGNMGYMFYNCSKLTNLDVFGFVTSNVTNMSYMFYNCSLLETLDLSSFNTRVVSNMNNMFYGCACLRSVSLGEAFSFKNNIYNVANFGLLPTPSAFQSTGCWIREDGVYGPYTSGEMQTNYSGVMAGVWIWEIGQPTLCAVLYSNGDLVFQSSSVPDESRGTVVGVYTGFDKDMYFSGSFAPWYVNHSSIYRVVFLTDVKPVSTAYWFYGCDKLTNVIDVSRLDTSDVVDMQYMFSYCSLLFSLDLSDWDTSNVMNMQYMFNNCTSLLSLDVTNFDTSKVTNMYSMFYNCRVLASLDLSSFDTNKVTSMSYMFYNCQELTFLDLSIFDTSCVTTMQGMFYYCSKLINVDVSNFDTGKVTNMGSMFAYCNNLVGVDVSDFDTHSVTDMSYMFQNCSKLTFLDVSHFDTSKVYNMSSMFYGCFVLSVLDVSSFDTGRVTNMYSMFYNCRVLVNIDVSNFDVSRVSNMSCMFYSCQCLSSLDVSRWNTSSATDMSSMFYGCSNLENLNVFDWNTSKVTSMYYMFYNCSKLKTLDLSNWATSKVTSAYYMFYNCSSLFLLDVSSFDMSKLSSMHYMFYNRSSVKELDLSGFSTANVTNMQNMLQGCISLRCIELPSSFNFKGNNISYTSYWAILPMPPSSADGKWVRDDGVYGPYTPTELRDNWAPSMAGTWVWAVPDNDTGLYAVMYSNGDLVFQTGILPDKSRGSISVIYDFDDSVDYGSDLPWNTKKGAIRRIVFAEPISPVSMAYWCSNMRRFVGFESVTNLTTSNVSSMRSLFENCSSLGGLDLSTFDTSNVTDMGRMFAGDDSLSEIKLGSNFSFKGNGITDETKQAVLPTPSYEDPYTGLWVRRDDISYQRTSRELTNDYDASYAGDWVWDRQMYFDGRIDYELTDSENTSGVVDSYDLIDVTFTNTMVVVPVSVNFMVNKIADFDYDRGDFSFDLFDSEGNIVQTATNSAMFLDSNESRSTVMFDSVTFDAIGDYRYYVREVKGSNGSVDYDESWFVIDVSVNRDEYGVMSADVVYSALQ